MNEVLMTDSDSETNRHAAKPLLASAQPLLPTWCSSVPGAGAALSPGAVHENAVGALCLLQQQPQPLQRCTAQHQPGHGLSCFLLSPPAPPALHLFFTLPSCSGLLVPCTQHSPPFLNTFRNSPSWLRATVASSPEGSATSCLGATAEPAETSWSRLGPAGTGWDEYRARPASTCTGAKVNGRPCSGRGAAAPAISWALSNRHHCPVPSCWAGHPGRELPAPAAPLPSILTGPLQPPVRHSHLHGPQRDGFQEQPPGPPDTPALTDTYIFCLLYVYIGFQGEKHLLLLAHLGV